MRILSVNKISKEFNPDSGMLFSKYLFVTSLMFTVSNEVHLKSPKGRRNE